MSSSSIGGEITVFPRLESVAGRKTRSGPTSVRRMSTGVDGLDKMLGGGLIEGSTTAVFGTPGIGKTLLNLQFLGAGGWRTRPASMLRSMKPPRCWRRRATDWDSPTGSSFASACLHVMWQPALERSPDGWAWSVLEAVDEFRPARLTIDAFTDVARMFAVPSRQTSFGIAFSNELRTRGVTTLVNLELDSFVSQTVDFPVPRISPMIDSGILMRSVELDSEIRRMISVMKHRQSWFDPTIREFYDRPRRNHGGRPYRRAATAADIVVSEKSNTSRAGRSQPHAPTIVRCAGSLNIFSIPVTAGNLPSKVVVAKSVRRSGAQYYPPAMCPLLSRGAGIEGRRSATVPTNAKKLAGVDGFFEIRSVEFDIRESHAHEDERRIREPHRCQVLDQQFRSKTRQRNVDDDDFRSRFFQCVEQRRQVVCGRCGVAIVSQQRNDGLETNGSSSATRIGTVAPDSWRSAESTWGDSSSVNHPASMSSAPMDIPKAAAIWFNRSRRGKRIFPRSRRETSDWRTSGPMRSANSSWLIAELKAAQSNRFTERTAFGHVCSPQLNALNGCASACIVRIPRVGRPTATHHDQNGICSYAFRYRYDIDRHYRGR